MRYFSGSLILGSSTLAVLKRAGPNRAMTAAATWQQAELVRAPLRQVQWWEMRRCSLAPRSRWFSGLFPTASIRVMVW